MTEVTLEHIQVSYLKSAKLVDLESASINAQGIDRDRMFMVTRNNGQFLSQRQSREMTQLTTKIDGDVLIVNHPNMTEDLVVSLWPPANTPIQVVMHNKDELLQVIPVGASASSWLSEAIGKKEWNPLQLVTLDSSFERITNSDFIIGEKVRFGLTDAGPLTIHSIESEAALNNLLHEHDMPKIDRRRFRSTLVFSGFPNPLDEMGFSIGSLTRIAENDAREELRLKLIRPVPRCPIPQLNPDTGERDLGGEFAKSVLPELNRKFGLEGRYQFGEYAILDAQENGNCSVKVGERFRFEKL